jgi:hypothetical protein
MADLDYLEALVAGLAALVVSFVWYSAFTSRLVALSPAYVEGERSPSWKILAELARCVVVAAVVGSLVAGLALESAVESVGLALTVWFGFPVMILVGAVLWERVPWRLAATHAGDWLIKLIVVTVIVWLWPGEP